MLNKILIRLLSITTCIFFSCGNNNETKTPNEKDKSFTLRINFKENILNTNPYEAETESEKFVRDICFENIFKNGNKGLESRVFEHWSYDSVEYVLHFELSDNIFFQNGAKMTISDVQTGFLTILEKVDSHVKIRTFFEEISGWRSFQSKLNFIKAESSLPDGFQFVDDKRFKIKFSKKQNDPLRLVSDLDVFLTRKQNGSWLGTGPFVLQNLDSDILCDLIRNKHYDIKESNIEHINIRFIKDPETEIREFENGSLDIIFPKLGLIKMSKYDNYNSWPTNQGVLRFAYWSGDLSLQSFKDLEQNVNQPILFVNADDTYNFATRQQFLVNLKSNRQDIDSTSFDSFKSINQKEANPVIEERLVNYFQSTDQNKLAIDLANELKLADGTRLMLLESKPHSVLTNLSLRGLSPYERLSDAINRLHFVSPSKY